MNHPLSINYPSQGGAYPCASWLPKGVRMKTLVCCALLIAVLVVVAFNMMPSPTINSVVDGASNVSHIDTSHVQAIGAEGPFKALVDWLFCLANTNNINACTK